MIEEVLTCCLFCAVLLPGALSTCAGGKYRTFDGSCNNLIHPSWGKAETAQRRFNDNEGFMVDFFDGDDIPRGGIPSTLPSPRAITNLLSDESLGPKNQFDKLRSAQSFAQGQIVAHDLVSTKFHSDVDCCDPDTPESSDINVCFPFTIPANDNKFPPRSCKNFIRAVRASDTEASSHREQINMATSYLDASFLYGSSETQNNKLRGRNGFLLRTDDGNLPTKPAAFADPCVKTVQIDRCPFAGDSRVSEAPNLHVNHLVWVREHNRIARFLYKLNKNWNNEKIFQETRKIIIAMWQHIIYNEHLPNVVGKKTMKQFGLLSTNSGFNDVYSSSIDASIRNGFAVGAYRFGHSQVVKEQSLLADDYTTLTVNKLEENFFNPHILQTNNGSNIEDLARWLTYTPSMKVDIFLVDSLRSKLFKNIGQAGEDLMSRNIQRGRDQGIPGYNRWRQFCGLNKFVNFKQFGDAGTKLQQLYNDVDDVDLMVGGLLEDSNDGVVGKTFSCIIGQQFQLLKTGDRFWYERGGQDFSFTEEQLNSIKAGSLLSRVFCRNFNLSKIQRDIFTPGQESTLTDCGNLPEIDLNLWKEQN